MTASVSSRRSFIRTASGAIAGAAAIQRAAQAAPAAGADVLRVGLIGCGGRGTKAAGQALRADDGARLVAMGDAFTDRLESSLAAIQAQDEVAGKIDVPPDRRFVGFDAFKQVTDASDVVLLATPPHFRPMHLKYAIDQGKHVFCEKPVAVDAPGVRSVMASCQLAQQKKLSVVSGLCLRYSQGYQETVKRIQGGAIGRPVALEANDFRGQIWVKPRQPNWSDMTYQMRNWYYFTWLSGDFNVEQHVHMLDVCSWVMGDRYPVKAIGTGGRAARTGPEFGNIFDHFAINYEYADGTRLFAQCRQQRNCKNHISTKVLGENGLGELTTKGHVLSPRGGDVWRYDGPRNDFYQTEHDELFASIRAGKPINNGDYMSKTTLLAIMGRFAAYTGREITWDAAMNSTLDLSPPSYDWDQPLPERPAAVPGVTKFV